MEGKIVSWWENLTVKEQELLITMLFNMKGEDFRAFGIEIDESGDKYIEVKK